MEEWPAAVFIFRSQKKPSHRATLRPPHKPREVILARRSFRAMTWTNELSTRPKACRVTPPRVPGPNSLPHTHNHTPTYTITPTYKTPSGAVDSYSTLVSNRWHALGGGPEVGGASTGLDFDRDGLIQPSGRSGAFFLLLLSPFIPLCPSVYPPCSSFDLSRAHHMHLIGFAL